MFCSAAQCGADAHRPKHAHQGSRPAMHALLAALILTWPCPRPCPAAGSFQQDAQLNRALYGPDATSRDILGGRVPCPPEFAPVYALLAQLQQAAGPVPGPMPRSSSQLRHLSVAGQGRVSANPLGSRAPSRPPSRQGSGSGSGRSRSVFAAAGGTAAGQTSPRPLPSGNADDGSPPLPAQNGKAAANFAPSAPGSPQPPSARSTSPGRPPLHSRSRSPRMPFGDSPRPPRSESTQPAAYAAAAETQLVARGRTADKGSDQNGRSADSSPESPASRVHALPF